MAWLCNCDDDTDEVPKSKPPPPQPKRSSRDAQHQNQQAQRMPPSEGELAPEFSVAPPGLEGQSGVATSNTSMRTRNYSAAIEAGGASSCSRKKSSSGDIIRRADEPGGVVRKASRESRRSDKGSVKGDENEEAVSPPETPGAKSDSSDKHKRHKEHKRHEREKAPCDCPMYEVEVIRKPAAGTGRQLPSDKLGMQVVTTETVTKRQFTYNMDVDLPEGMRVSPRGKLVEDQGVSAEQGLGGMSPYALEPYQPPYGQNYGMPQGAASQQLQPVSRFEQYQQQQISVPGRTYGVMQAASYEALAPVARYDTQPRAQPFRADMYNQPPQVQPQQFNPQQFQAPQLFQPPQIQSPQMKPPQIQQVQIVQRYGIEPKKVESLVFQCMCGHGQNSQKSTTTSSCTTSKTKTTSTTKSTSTKATGNRTSSSTKSSKDKKSSKGSSSSKNSASMNRGKGSSSTTSSSSSTTSSSTKNKKADEKPGFMQVDIHCDKCRIRKTYLVCNSCYSRHKITTCKDCKAPTVREYIKYPSNNALLNAGARMTYQPELPPQGYGQQQQQQQYGQRFRHAGYQEQTYEGAMVQALADKQAGLVVCCSSRTMLPISNANMVGGPVYQDPGAAQGAVTTNIILLDVMPHEQEEEEECATSSSTTKTSTSSVQSPTKTGTRSPTKSTGKSRTTTKTRSEDEQRGSSFCKCGHDSRTCRVCSEKKHIH